MVKIVLPALQIFLNFKIISFFLAARYARF